MTQLSVADFTSLDYVSTTDSGSRTPNRIRTPLRKPNNTSNPRWQTTGTYSFVTGLMGTGQAISLAASAAITSSFVPGPTQPDTLYSFCRLKTSSTASNHGWASLGSSTHNLVLTCLSTGVLRVTVGDANYDSSGITIAADTIYMLEVVCYIANSGGAFEVRLNGSQVSGLVQSGIDTKTTAYPLAYMERAGWGGATAMTVDDCCVKYGVSGGWDSDDFLTDGGKIPLFGTLYPNGDGHYTAWDIGGDYTDVDETVCDLTDFIAHNAGAGSDIQKQSVVFEDTPSNFDYAYAVIPRGAVRAETDSNAVCDMGLRLGGTDYDSPDNDDEATVFTTFLGVGNQADYESRLYMTSPATSAAFTKTGLDAIEVYFEQSTNSNFGGGCVGRMDLYHVVIEYLWYAQAEAEQLQYGLALCGVLR